MMRKGARQQSGNYRMTPLTKSSTQVELTGRARRQGTVPRAGGSGSGSGRQADEDWKKAQGSILGAGDVLILSLHCLLCASSLGHICMMHVLF